MHIVVIYSEYGEPVAEAKKLNPHGAEQMRSTVESVQAGLEFCGHKVSAVKATVNLLSDIQALEKPDVLFNLSSGITNKRTQANVVGMLEMLEIPIVGSGLSTHVLGLHKEVTKVLLREAGIRTAGSQLFKTGDEAVRPDLRFPVLVKPEHEGSSVGVDTSSFVEHPEDLPGVIRAKMEVFNQVVIAEEYMPGREFTVGVLGNRDPEVLPFKEYLFQDNHEVHFLTTQAKADDVVTSVCPADVGEALADEIRTMAIAAFKTLRCRDFARIDFRLDAQGKPNVLELNTLPGLQKGYSDFPEVAEAAGYTYEALLDRLVQLACAPREKE